MNSNTLRVTEIFYSLQGESTLVGLPTVFVRLTGCPLRCSYCDTAYAFTGGEKMSLVRILGKIAVYHTPYVTVTGGEPLAQKSSYLFLTQLCDLNYQVSLETSGALPIQGIDPRVIVIMDLKTPSSKEEHRNLYDNISHLKATDQIKFVIGDADDYQWAKRMLEKYQLMEKAICLFSPVYGKLTPKTLAEWILQDQLNIRMQIQLHKYIWGDIPGV